MARTIDEIQQSMLDAITADPTLSVAFTNIGRFAIFRLFTRIVATCAWTVEVLFDTLKAEINELLAKLKPHSTRWYAEKAKSFQYGYALIPDSDKYDNTGISDDDVAASQIIKYCAVTEGLFGDLRIKVATITGDDLAPIDAPQKAAFSAYMKLVKDAGVPLQIDSLPADSLKLSLKIYYDPLILNNLGQRIDGADDAPVQNAVDTYLKNLPFNGVFVLAFLTDALQKVSGVVIPHIVACQTQYGALPFISVNVLYTPDSGYLRFANVGTDLTIEYVAQSQI